MNETVLKELATKWVRDAIPPDCCDGSEEAKVSNALAQGMRMGFEKCANDLRKLIDLLGQ